MIEFEKKDRYDINDYREIIRLLRTPEGCPWDREQTHESIRKNLLEEAYEAAEAIDTGDAEHLKEELGDVLMQVLLHSQMEEERGVFSLDDVADASCKKLIFRHPHVFGGAAAGNADEALDSWDAAKRVEKAQKTVSSSLAAVCGALPALWRAEKIQEKTARVGFDFPDVGSAIAKLREETDELCEGIAQGSRENMEEELGDILFSAANVARFLKLDPEAALNGACGKYARRFEFVERCALEKGDKLENMTLEELEKLYQRARMELEGKEIQISLDI